MLPPRDGDPRESNLLSEALTLFDNASGSLTDISKVFGGSGTVDKRLERFSSATINSRSFGRY